MHQDAKKILTQLRKLCLKGIEHGMDRIQYGDHSDTPRGEGEVDAYEEMLKWVKQYRKEQNKKEKIRKSI